MMKIAVFGGAFDPIHNGHLNVAYKVLKTFNIDRFIFLPGKRHAFKGEISLISDTDRLQLIQLAIKQEDKFEIDDFELKSKESVNYTYHYLEKVKNEKTELFFIIGSDNLQSFTKWYRWKDILNVAKVISYSRPGYDNKLNKDLNIYADRFILFNDKLMEISSSDIKNGKIESSLFPPGVYEYIIKKRLYDK